jgi:putative solute:sodium symporter small subunit
VIPRRDRLVRRLRSHLEQHGHPRLEMAVVVSLAGMAGFILSYALLAAGYTSMPLRYMIAATGAYIAFLTLLGLYVAWKRRLEAELDPLDALDAVSHLEPWRLRPGLRDDGAFSGGRSGGAGHSASWGDSSAGSSSTAWMDGDLDLGWVLLIVVAAVAGVIAVGSIVWTAPMLLAEVLVDALIVSTVSHQLSQTERRDWTATAIRRTWIPAVVVILTVVVGGWALQRIAPQAVSVGPALRAILG